MATKEQLKKVVMTKKKNYGRSILIVSIAFFALFILFAILNATEQVDWSFKSLEHTDANHDGVIDDRDPFGTDTNEDGVIDRWDGNPGYDSGDPYDWDQDGNFEELDGIPDQGQQPMQRMMNFMFLGVAILLGPYAFWKSGKDKNIEAIEKRLPDFLRDVAEAGRFGMTLADAIVVASSGRYGKLTPEIQKMAAQIEWGVPASEAMRLFALRINTPMINRVVSIVIKASDAGGNVADVLTMVSHDTKELQLSQDERKIEMSTYLAVIYISFFVFLVTIIILNVTFLPKIREAGMSVTRASLEAGIGTSGATSLDVSAIPNIELAFFLASMIHAIGDGLMAGVLQNGKISEGLKHSFILLVLGILVLTLV